MDKPRIAIVGGGASMAMAAAAILAAGHQVDIVSADHIRTGGMDLFPEPPRWRDPPQPRPHQPIVLGGGFKHPKWPVDPIKAAARKRQNAARKRNK